MTDTTAVIDQFNAAVLERAPDKLVDLIAPDCVMEGTGPAPDGNVWTGYDERRSRSTRRLTRATAAADPRQLIGAAISRPLSDVCGNDLSARIHPGTRWPDPVSGHLVLG